MSEVAVVRPGRGRRPIEEVRAAVRGAAWRLLLADGLGGVTVDRVASTAGVSRTTLYKWWPSLGVLAVEALAAGVDDALAILDTGDLDADLVAALRMFAGVLRDSRTGRVVIELLGAAQSDPELADAFRRSYLVPRRAVGTRFLARARSRGQLRGDVDLEVLSDQLWGSCMYRLMTGLHPLDDAYLHELVRNVLPGVRA